ncbi:response regulator transcription factor [Streptomyces sp. NPDC090106]|uniref:response regulator transcription factor n=1 Tax=Streptomyces sp. NPDC090106 TaxID=3365946 RepID=UPI0037F957E5
MYAHLMEKPAPPRGAGQRLLVIAGDCAETELLTTTLELADYRVRTAHTGAEGMARLARCPYDLVVLDVTLPDLGQLARGRRMAPADRPPLLYLASCDALHRLLPELGLEGEDYVIRPVRVPEVLARVQVLLRRRAPEPRPGALGRGGLVLDDLTCRAVRGPRALDLTPAEYRLLRHLLANAGCVLSKEQISRHVWGEFRGHQAIEKLVSRLRHKVDREEPALIHTRRGFGYWLGAC